MRESIRCVCVDFVSASIAGAVCCTCERAVRCCVSLSACTACVQREKSLRVSVRAYIFASTVVAAAVGWWMEIAFWLLFLFSLLPLPMQQLNRTPVSEANNIKITLQSITCTYDCSKVLVHADYNYVHRTTGTRCLRHGKARTQPLKLMHSHWFVGRHLLHSNGIGHLQRNARTNNK